MHYLGKFFALTSLFLFVSCAGYVPLYENYEYNNIQMRNMHIMSDKKKATDNLKKELLKSIKKSDEVNYILKLETTSNTKGTVSDIDRRITEYEIEISVIAELYERLNYDKLIFSLEDKQIAPYNLSSGEVLSTLASRNKAEALTIKLLAQSIFEGLTLFFKSNKKNAS